MMPQLSRLACVCALTVGLALPVTSFAEQVCLAGVPESAAGDEFEELDDGILWHKRTNLVWMQCSIGQTWDGGDCLGEATKMTWQDALALSLGYEFAGSRQWRLPNLKELSSITEKACVRPSIAEDTFPMTPPDDYWTSTPSMNDELRAWVVAFFNASISIKEKDRSLHIRLVRTALPAEREE